MYVDRFMECMSESLLLSLRVTFLIGSHPVLTVSNDSARSLEFDDPPNLLVLQLLTDLMRNDQAQLQRSIRDIGVTPALHEPRDRSSGGD